MFFMAVLATPFIRANLRHAVARDTLRGYHRPAPADSRSEGIRFLLQSGAAAPGDRATHPGAKGATTWDGKDQQGNRRPCVERAAPQLPLGCRKSALAEKAGGSKG